MILGNSNWNIFTNNTNLYDMKKIIYFVFAAFALVACEPNNGAIEKVRIGVSLDDNTQPAKGPQRISAVDGTEEIVIKWEKGDVLYYADNINPINYNKYFTLISGDDTQTAVFECDNFDLEGESFNLYYHGLADPLNVQQKGATNPNFASPIPLDQECTLNDKGKTVINNDYLVYKGIGCKIGRGIVLEPDFSILGVVLKGSTNFSQYVSIGTGFGENNNTAYMCNLGNVNLANNPIFYFVLPSDYNLGDKQIRLSTSRGHNTSAPLNLPNIQLTPAQAQIIAVTVTRNTDYDDVNNNSAYTITPTAVN